jgi:hypothetical protein
VHDDQTRGPQVQCKANPTLLAITWKITKQTLQKMKTFNNKYLICIKPPGKISKNCGREQNKCQSICTLGEGSRVFYLFMAERAIFELSRGCHHYRWHGCKFRPMLGTYGF